MQKDQKFWDKIAPKYARDPIADEAAYEQTLARTISYLDPQDRVLELGCGTGSTALRIAPHVAFIVGTDLSPGMIEIAHSKATAQGIDAAEFRAADTEAAFATADRPNAVLGFNLFHLVPNAAKDFTRVYAALPSGGLFISKTPCLGNIGVLKWVLFHTMIPIMKALGKAPGFVRFYRQTDLEAEIEAAGFTIIEALNAPAISRYLVARKP